tara:strand:- start:288 stop:713 length:426 start_codon:yes stop_codon:yes gene_type:complete
MIEDDFYGTLKFKNGEEIFAKIAASEEEDRTMLIVHTPVKVSEVKAKGGIIGYKVEPWLKTSREDMFIINMDNVLTLSESSDMEMIGMYQNFLQDYKRDTENNTQLNRKMGYLATVNAARGHLEKIFKESPNNTKSSPDQP